MQLSAREYCELFRMDEPKYNFNRQEFIKKFGLDFIDSCRLNKNVNKTTGYLTYKAFKKEVSHAQKVFNEISSEIQKAGKKPLSKGLFNVFYATYVIVARKSLYKEVQAKIDHKKLVTETQWAALKPLQDKLHSDEHKTKNKPKEKG